MARTIVSVRSASKRYRLGKVDVDALRDASVEVTEGDFVAVAGPSGSGKTTLLNLIGCIDTPTTGIVEVAGLDTQRLSDRRLTDLRLHTIGFIFQSFHLVGALDVYRNVELPLLLQRVRRTDERRRRVMELLERVGLQELVRHRPGELSGGQRQRVAIARALVTRPKLVLADEPTANLDSETGHAIVELMRALNESEGTTFVFSTHDPRVMSHADEIFRMVDGRLVREHDAAPRLPPAPLPVSVHAVNG